MSNAFEAELTFDGDEMERSQTVTGEDCVRFANVTVRTDHETVERTIMAFGDNVPITDDLAFPRRPVRFLIEDRGPIFVVAGRAA